jgi:general nucleoside transport system permease protein
MDFLLVLQFAAPVALAALGETVGQRSGVLNIGLEGKMLAGAFFAVLATLTTGSPWAGLMAGTVAGTALSALSALFCVRLRADQVVVGLAVNLLAIGLTGTLYRARFGQSGELLSVPRIPSISGLDPVLVLLLVAVPATWWWLGRTSGGLALRASGEYPMAAEAAGFSVERLRYLGLMVSGTAAGLAGAYLSLGVAGSFAENMTAGRGFVAIALVTFGRWSPPWVFFAALLIGYLDSLQYTLQGLGNAVPFQLLVALPYVVALAVLVGAGRSRGAPAALGTSYRREGG